MSIYKSENWRQHIIDNPPKSAQLYSQEEWEEIVMNELMNANVFNGEDNGNFGNPTNYSHPESVKMKIKENHSRHWANNEVPWKGKPRPDSVEIARNMGKASAGKDPWNKGLTVGPMSEDHKTKIGQANKKPKPKLTCPHCNKTGGAPQMKQWHFEKCKDILCA